MYPHHAPEVPRNDRALARDRAILALAAALCGAIAAAGVAAVAIAGQLHTHLQSTALSQATDALELANRRLGEARQELHEARAQVPAPAAPTTCSPPPITPTNALVTDAAVITHVGITCPEEHVCRIHHEVIEAAHGDPAAFARTGRYIPSVRDGQFLGIKVYGLRNGGVLKLIGLRNGDRIDAVDGVPLGSLAQAADVFSRFREPGAVLHLAIDRRGETIHKRLELF